MAQTTLPSYELAVEDLAKWIEAQGDDCWWTVDYDPRLGRLLSLPCPGDELAIGLRRFHGALRVFDPRANPPSLGHAVTVDNLDALVGHWDEHDEARILMLAWHDSKEPWLLVEDISSSTSERSGE